MFLVLKVWGSVQHRGSVSSLEISQYDLFSSAKVSKGLIYRTDLKVSIIFYEVKLFL